MASEQKRGCGYRKVGGTYLVGGMSFTTCDRLPYELKSCPVCGGGIHFTRGLTEIDPLQLFGIHEDCKDIVRPCYMCDPTSDPAWIQTVGEKFYPLPSDFILEAQAMGISKRINRPPIELGDTRESLDRKLADLGTRAFDFLETLPVEKQVLGIFAAFVPKAIEKLYWQSELDAMSPEDKEDLERQHITPVGIPDGDTDHA